MSALQIGLTGGIGSGKSTAAKIFAELGAKIIDADVLAREAFTDVAVREALVETFGNHIVTNGVVDRKALAEIVFADDAQRERLNAIVHPWVHKRRAELVKQYEDERVVVHEIPLLYEVGMDDDFDAVVVITASEQLRAQRVYERSGLSIAEFTARDRAQMSLSEKAKRADHVIDNDGSFERLRRRITALWRELVAPE